MSDLPSSFHIESETITRYWLDNHDHAPKKMVLTLLKYKNKEIDRLKNELERFKAVESGHIIFEEGK